jgi:coenzyme PQQ precursor peptide PqqA
MIWARCRSRPKQIGHELFRKGRKMKKAWKKPKVVEIAVGLEINSYACAELKK